MLSTIFFFITNFANGGTIYSCYLIFGPTPSFLALYSVGALALFDRCLPSSFINLMLHPCVYPFSSPDFTNSKDAYSSVVL